MIKGFWSRDISPWWLFPFGLAAVIVVIYFCSHWFECHPGTAAWLQAIGIPFTIAAAIYATWRENKNALDRDARNRRERSQAIGEFVAADYFNFRTRVELLWQAVQQREYDECTPRRSYSDMLAMLKLDVPKSFEEALWMAVDADRDELKPCTDIIHAATMHNNYLDDFGMMLGMTPEQWRAILATITTGLDGVRTFCTRAWPFFAKDTPDPLPDVLAQLKQQQEEI